MTVQIPHAFGFLFEEVADDGLPVRYRAAHGGRGAAKSHSFAQATILKAAERPLRVGWYREVQKSIRDSAKRLLDDKIAATPELRGFYSSTDTEIRGANDSLFIFNGLRSNPEAVKSTEGLDIAVVMEADRVSQRSWDLLTPTVRRPGSEIWAEWNPEDPTAPIDAFFRGEGGPPPRSIVRRVSYRDNPWFPEVLKIELEYDRKRDFDKYQWKWEGEYLQSSERRVFKNWRVDEFEPAPDAVFRFGADWGFAVDPTVLIRCYLEGKTLYVDHEAYLVGCEIDVTPQLFDSIPGSRKYLITADSARPETVSYMQRQGFRIAPAIKGQGSVEDGVEFLRSFDIVVHPRCTHLIDELKLYSYKVDPLTDRILPVLEDRHNHCVVEGTLISTHRGQVPIEQVRAGDQVKTSVGYRAVLFSGVTGMDRPVLSVRTTLGEALCTPDHKIRTQRGFVRADALRYTDEVFGDEECQSASFTKDWFTSASRKILERATAAIFAALLAADRRSFIDSSGNRTSVLYRRGITSITGTATPPTTIRPIWNASHQPSIAPSIRSGRLAWSGNARTSTGYVPQQSLGIARRRAARFIAGLGRWLIGRSSPNRSYAPTAAWFSFLESLAISTAFAPTPASPLGAGHLALMMWKEAASPAGKPSWPTATASRKLARGRVLTVCEQGVAKRVYDLTVEDAHEFYANGVLVSNCIDALRYGLEGARRAADAKPKIAPAAPRVPVRAGAGWMRR